MSAKDQKTVYEEQFAAINAAASKMASLTRGDQQYSWYCTIASDLMNRAKGAKREYATESAAVRLITLSELLLGLARLNECCEVLEEAPETAPEGHPLLAGLAEVALQIRAGLGFLGGELAALPMLKKATMG